MTAKIWPSNSKLYYVILDFLSIFEKIAAFVVGGGGGSGGSCSSSMSCSSTVWHINNSSVWKCF